MTPEELAASLKQTYETISEILGIPWSDLQKLESLTRVTYSGVLQAALLSSVNSKLGEIVTQLSTLADGLKKLTESPTTTEQHVTSRRYGAPF